MIDKVVDKIEAVEEALAGRPRDYLTKFGEAELKTRLNKLQDEKNSLLQLQILREAAQAGTSGAAAFHVCFVRF